VFAVNDRQQRSNPAAAIDAGAPALVRLRPAMKIPRNIARDAITCIPRSQAFDAMGQGCLNRMRHRRLAYAVDRQRIAQLSRADRTDPTGYQGKSSRAARGRTSRLRRIPWTRNWPELRRRPAAIRLPFQLAWRPQTIAARLGPEKQAISDPRGCSHCSEQPAKRGGALARSVSCMAQISPKRTQRTRCGAAPITRQAPTAPQATDFNPLRTCGPCRQTPDKEANLRAAHIRIAPRRRCIASLRIWRMDR